MNASRTTATLARALAACALLSVLLSAGTAPAARAAPSRGSCASDGRQASGAVYRICMPAQQAWNGSLIVYAHGYVPFNAPVVIPEDQLALPGGPSLADIATGLGFAFATTSYSTNGLAVRQAVEDLVDLVHIFRRDYGEPRHVYLAGVSEGGLITALAVEKHPEVFSGGLAACGPVGGLDAQISYLGDARLLFDHYFPGVLPGSPVALPQEAIDKWEAVYRPRVEAALRADPGRLKQFVATARVPVEGLDGEAQVAAVTNLMWYAVFATGDAAAKLGGQPYDNTSRLYLGSADDAALNRSLPRYRADPAAQAEVAAHYQTTGRLSAPLVMLHTTGDPLVPYWHELLYDAKLGPGDARLHANIPCSGNGHCGFTAAQVLVGLVSLIRRVTGEDVRDAERVLPGEQARAEYRAQMQAAGLR